MRVILRQTAVELGSDEHGFIIEGMAPAHETRPAVATNTLLQWWADDDPDFQSFLVMTGSQWGPFAVEVRIHDAYPGAIHEGWEDVVDVSVVTSGEVVVGEIVDGPQGYVQCDRAPHRMRVASRGRTESAARDYAVTDPDEDDGTDEEPLEHYLVELWPAPPAPAMVVRELSAYARDAKDPPAPIHPIERDPGLVSAWAVVHDLQGGTHARELPGVPTTVTVAMELPGTPVHLYNRARYVFGWPPCAGTMGSPDPAGTVYHDATLPEYDRYAQVGHIATTEVEALKPKRIVMRWNWVLPGSGPLVNRPSLLAEDSTVTITIASINGADEPPRCLVRIVHDGAPEVWAHDLQQLWRWHLAVQAARP